MGSKPPSVPKPRKLIDKGAGAPPLPPTRFDEPVAPARAGLLDIDFTREGAAGGGQGGVI